MNILLGMIVFPNSYSDRLHHNLTSALFINAAENMFDEKEKNEMNRDLGHFCAHIG